MKQDILEAARDPKNKDYLIIDGFVYRMVNDVPQLVLVDGEPVGDDN